MAKTNEEHEGNVGWPLWKCTILTSVLCSIPLLCFVGVTSVSAIIWGVCILVYVGIVRLYDPGHVIIGALLVMILATVSGLVLR